MLYLIQLSNYLKIGYTNNLDKRLKHYETHNPDYVVLYTREGSQSNEALLHNLLKNYFINETEWMKYDSFIIECFNNLVLPNINKVKSKSSAIQEESLEDSFYMTFIDYIGPIYGLKPEAIKGFLAWLCSRAEFNTGNVTLNANIRKTICKELNITNNTITNYLKKLKDAKIISGEKGSYIINPKIFWKGELGVRSQEETIRKCRT